MKDPRPPEGGAGVQRNVERPARRSQDTADTSRYFATRLPVPSLVAALDHLDGVGLCSSWWSR